MQLREATDREPENDRLGAFVEVRAGLLQDIVTGTPLATWLEKVTCAIERLTPGLMASVLLVEGDRLRLAAAPSLPESYNRLVDGKPVGEGFGSCGTAAFRAQLVVVSDIQNDPLWKNYREIARRYALGACWSMPIWDRRKRVVGTFALYYRDARSPREDELALIREFSQLAAVGIDHHRLEARLAESGAKFNDLVDDLGVIVWEAGPDGRQPTHISRAAERAIGHPLDHWHEQPGLWPNLVLPEDREATVRQYEQALRAGTSYECEYRVTAADGRILWLRDIFHAKGDRAAGLRGVTVNITRQRTADQEREEMLQHLSTERALLKTALAQLPVGIAVVDAAGVVVFANDKVREVVGPHPPRALEPDLGAIPLHGSRGLRLVEDTPLERALHGGEIVDAEPVEVLRPNGVRAVVSVSAAPVRDATGAIVAAVALYSDVTASGTDGLRTRLLANAGALLGNSLDPAATLENVCAAMTDELADWCAVFLRGEDWLLHCGALSVRDAGKARLKADLQRLAPQPGGAPLHAAEVIATGRSRLHAAVGPDAFEPGAAKGDLLRVVRALGSQSAMTIPLRSEDKVLGALVCGVGGGRRAFDAKALELGEELGRRAGLALENARLYADARSAIRHREEFLSIAAHELKTPLGGLQLAIETLVMQLEKQEVDREVLRGRAAASQRHATRLARLIEQLLDVSTIGAGRMKLAREEMDLVECTKTVVARFHDELKSKGVDLLLHAPAPVAGHWDPHRIDQVITNLLSNAIKYGERQPVRVLVQGQDDRAVLRVEDQGIGMPGEVTQRIFRPFERGVAPGHYGGLGLGLHITAQIVAAHGGTVRVESQPRAGSAFTVELPREPA